tara:strand:- start:477 stop:692 length:216 start_codon:yes stop_codon:yes gene_type:complete
MRDLTKEVTAVCNARSLESKKVAMKALIESSHAKKETKKLFNIKVDMIRSPSALDKMATDYLLSGEGLKVR